ncbi:hormone receptor 4 isoform X2 [Rhopalosiphum maidis]|nr:hormone receptor 4 isoform X2 [Rhopalosiphum maidis]XP_026808644.1 hormone receptor 4 isoform X2 [Rhopalosiphum maidis]XP_026808646.1 hormone receptor 4 isoform X2 [Rhopalosiphum maidis]
MTLTSTPCDLSTMSLFQDLKLKRRKIDSRCSSDGESIADTSTSSPDVAGPASPSSRMDRSVPSPGLIISMDRMASSPECGSMTTDSGQDPNDVGEGVKVKEEMLDDPQPKDMIGTGYENGTVADNKTEPPSPSPSPSAVVTAALAAATAAAQHEQQQQRRESVVMTSPLSCVVKSATTPPPPQSLSSSSSSSSLSPPLTWTTVTSQTNPPPLRCYTPSSTADSMSVTQQYQQRRQSVVTSVSSAFWNAGTQTSPASTAPGNASVATAAAASVLSVCRINGVRPELIGGAGFATTAAAATGNTDMKPPTAIPPRTTRSAPTVIMGEAGGVRTMIWSSPPCTVEQSTSPASTGCGSIPSTVSTPYWSSAATWSSNTSSVSSPSPSPSAVSEESAAHLLLNLGVAAGHDVASVISHMPGLRPIGGQLQQTSVASGGNGGGGNVAGGGQQSFHVPLNMERLWAGDLSQLPVAATHQMHALNLTANTGPAEWPMAGPNGDNKSAPVNAYHQMEEADEQEQPMVCMICDDRATGLHYGIITCEGCKGFFKRTVQNRRIYTCIAEGTCEITKAQRNRCQYCRFKKCIGQGMVLQAVREDRMPGGRNSGAVYNLYKVKYKKKRPPKNGQVKMEKSVTCTTASTMTTMKTENQDNNSSSMSTLVNGTILKTALTNPSEVVYLRQRLDNAVSSSRDRTFSIEATVNMIKNLVDCDEFQDIATLRNMEDLLEHNSDLSAKLMQIGDSIVYKLVQWTKRLPFYLELPVEVHTRLLTHKWHELLVLTTSAYQAIHGPQKIWNSTNMNGDRNEDSEFHQEVSHNLCILQNCLSSMMGKPITMDQLRQDVGVMVEKITHVTLMFRRVKLRMEEYVCLKVIIMLTQSKYIIPPSRQSRILIIIVVVFAYPSIDNGNTTSELETIQERYTSCLKTYVEHTFPMQPNRLQDLLHRLPEIQSAASLLLESKMFYVPFLLNSTIRS